MDTRKRSAFDEAARYLSNRMRTVSEMRTHLLEKEYEREEIEEVIRDFLSMNYLNDETYAKLFFERGYEKKRGVRRLKRELAERGVPDDVIQNAYEDFLYENGIDEYGTALGIARLEAAECREVTEKDLARIARRLANLGYANSDIYRILSVIRSEAAERNLDEDICDR